MKAGRELDALIAEKVMGYEVGWGIQSVSGGIRTRKNPQALHAHADGEVVRVDLPHYSTQIADAWLVVERFRRGTEPVDVACCVDLHISDWCTVPDCFVKIYSPALAPVDAHANEMPLAICLAALKAVGVDIE